MTAVFALVLIIMQSRRSELISRYDFIWKLQVGRETESSIIFQALDEQLEMKRRHVQNRSVLENILPSHVATRFLEETSTRGSKDLYSEV